MRPESQVWGVMRRRRGGTASTDPARGQRRLVGAVALGVLVACVAGSVVGALAWSSYVRGQTARQFGSSASTAAGALSIALLRDADLAVTARVLITTTPTLTNAQFSTWFRLLETHERYPGSFGLLYIEKVQGAQLAGFAQRATSDPPFGLAATSPFDIVPSDSTAPYCFTRVGSVQLSSGLHISSTLLSHLLAVARPGLNFCGLPVGRLLRESAASGKPAATTLASLVAETPGLPGETSLPANAPAILRRAGLIVTITPVYAGPTPSTSARRTASLSGWILGVYQAKSILVPILGGSRGLSAVLYYENPTGDRVVLDRTGKSTGALTRTFSLAGPGRWTVALSAPSAPGLSASTQGLAVLLGGLTVSFLLFLLIRVLIRSRGRALQLVAVRTAQLHHQSLHDGLTGLPNRALIFDRAEQMLNRAHRELTEVAALLVDLDQFTAVNDTIGNGAGDDLLRQAGERLGACLRATDTVGRIGGDEFVVLIEDALGASHPEEVARRLLDALAEPFSLGDRRDAMNGLSATIGIASGMRESAEMLVGDADIALHVAKATVPGRYAVFRPEMRDAVTTRLELEGDLRKALAQEQFFLVYQPIYDLEDKRIRGAEALLRWRHPVRGVVMPAQFVPTLEQTGMIFDAGRFVIERACLQAASWHRAGHVLSVSVNVSASQLDRGDFVDTVKRALRSASLPPGVLTLEITETALMRNAELAVRRMRALKEIGVKLAIDDFGTGYCSLAYLQQFPVDALKIDQSFVSGMESSSEGASLVRTIVQMGRDLGLETVAEGIETDSQLERLRLEHCVAGQGYLLARPLETSALSALLAAQGREPPVGAGTARG
jgi:diguanylate cyclase (GGDEF)-like protein